jgi:hypothetical protein
MRARPSDKASRQRVCSALTLSVSVGEDTKESAHAVLELPESGQLPFLG